MLVSVVSGRSGVPRHIPAGPQKKRVLMTEVFPGLSDDFREWAMKFVGGEPMKDSGNERSRIKSLEADVEEVLQSQVVLSHQVLELTERVGTMIQLMEGTHLIRVEMTKRIFELERRLNGLSSDSVED